MCLVPLPGPRGRLVSLLFAILGTGGIIGVSWDAVGSAAPVSGSFGVGAVADVSSSACAAGVVAPFAPASFAVGGVSVPGAGDASLPRPPTWMVIFLFDGVLSAP